MSKFACVTGASRGVGYELTKQLLEGGYTVFAGKYLSNDKMLKDLKDIYLNNLHIIDLDISNDESVKSAAEYTSKHTNKIDILINNGAILGDINKTLFDQLDFDEMIKVFSVNSLGALRMTNALIDLILNSDSKLIMNISSEAGSIQNCGRSNWFAYCMSKAALNMNSNLVHNEVQKSGGQVIVIHPGWVKTYMQGKLDEAADITPEVSAKGILNVAANYKKYKSDKPAFVDYLGRKMEW